MSIGVGMSQTLRTCLVGMGEEVFNISAHLHHDLDFTSNNDYMFPK